MPSFARTTAWILAIVAALGLLLHLFVFDVWVVPEGDALADSVEPNLRQGDVVLVRRGAIPTFGQLARCGSPSASSGYVVGRVFGTAGKTVEIRGESVFVDGKVIHAASGCRPVNFRGPVGPSVELSCAVFDTGGAPYAVVSRRADAASSGTELVEEGSLYLVSDNRYLHQDSRDFGPVDASACEHVVYRLSGASPLDAARRFGPLW